MYTALAVLTAGRLSRSFDRLLTVSSVKLVQVEVAIYLFAPVELTCWFGELTIYLASREPQHLELYFQTMFLVLSIVYVYLRFAYCLTCDLVRPLRVFLVRECFCSSWSY